MRWKRLDCCIHVQKFESWCDKNELTFEHTAEQYESGAMSKSYAEITEKLRDHFEPKPVIIAERFKFHKRN